MDLSENPIQQPSAPKVSAMQLTAAILLVINEFTLFLLSLYYDFGELVTATLLLAPAVAYFLLVKQAANRATSNAVLLCAVTQAAAALTIIFFYMVRQVVGGSMIFYLINHLSLLLIYLIPSFLAMMVLRHNAVSKQDRAWISMLLICPIFPVFRTLVAMLSFVVPNMMWFSYYQHSSWLHWVLMLLLMFLMAVGYWRLALLPIFSGRKVEEEVTSSAYLPLNKYAAAVGIPLAVLITAAFIFICFMD